MLREGCFDYYFQLYDFEKHFLIPPPGVWGLYFSLRLCASAVKIG
jgi:hypothetical protein